MCLGIWLVEKLAQLKCPVVAATKRKRSFRRSLAPSQWTNPRYVVLVSIFEPTGNRATGGGIVASRNAAPTTARVIERIAPLLNVAPRRALAAIQN